MGASLNKKLELSGFTFGRLTVRYEAGRDKFGGVLWHCECRCGRGIDVKAASLNSGNTRSCGCLYEDVVGSRRPKAAVRKAGAGYLNEYAPEHPGADSKGYVAQHRLRMEEIIGRFLVPGENVHHKNGVRHDNSPRNLELWFTGQPAGQRVKDLREWARFILTTYPEDV